MTPDPARAYRESVVRGASPVGLVVILFEEILRSLRKAQRALKENKIEQRTLELTPAVEVIGHLQVNLDFKVGGEVARNLSRFYDVACAKILEANIRADNAILEWLSAEFSAHIDTWQQLDRALTSSEAETQQASLEPAAAGASVRRARTFPPVARGRR